MLYSGALTDLSGKHGYYQSLLKLNAGALCERIFLDLFCDDEDNEVDNNSSSSSCSSSCSSSSSRNNYILCSIRSSLIYGV